MTEINQKNNLKRQRAELRQQITELKKSEAIPQKTWGELWRSEDYFRALIENSLDIIFVVNKKGTITYASPSVKRYLGYRPEELMGKSGFKLITPIDLPRAIYDFGKAILTKEIIIPNSFRVRHKDGFYCVLEGVGKNLLDNPAVKGFVMNVRDISKRRLSEEALKEREKELEFKSRNLEEVNIALKILLQRRDEDKAQLEEKILLNVKELIAPYFEKLKMTRLDENQKKYLSILETNLNDIVSPFSHKLSSMFLDFTPTEIQVANLLRQGKTNKEIGELFNCSPRTISFHRDNIRRKLGLKNKKTNLKSYLLTLQKE
jgi:PAS domain S-box-containing protein